MLNYLVTSKTRRVLLKLLWLDSASGTAQKLAQKSGVAFAGAYRELKAMAESGLARVDWHNGSSVYSANHTHPMANLLKQLLEDQKPEKKKEPANSVKLSENLAYLGLPVNARKTPPERNVKLETLLARAANLARSDASVARALPVLLNKVKDEIDFKTLKAESRITGNKHRVGFFLELTGQLSKDRNMREAAKMFFDNRYNQQKPFFQNQSKYSLQLAQERTPKLAKKWGWSMNLGLDAFESTYRKFNEKSISL